MAVAAAGTGSRPAAQEPPRFAWTAQWITAPDAPARDEAILHFRKILTLPAAPARFVVHVSADQQFLLHVNQQRVGTGPARGDLAHWRYETYDLAPFLHAGANVVAATVWNFGTHAALAQMTDRTGFVLQSEHESDRAIDTNATWEAKIDLGVETIRPQVRGYFAAEPGERLTGSAFDWAWDAPPAAGQPWAKAQAISRAGLREERDPPNNWQLVADGLPPMEMRLVPAGRVVRAAGIDTPDGFPDGAFVVPPGTRASVLLDNGHLTTGYPGVAVSGGRGAIVRLTYAEALVDDQHRKGNRNDVDGRHIEGIVDEFLPDGAGARQFLPLTWRTWRYLQIDVQAADQPVRVERLRTWFSAYPFDERASLDADDPSLAPIWEIGWRTARLDAHDTYMDTPYWERLQYVGDTRIQALISYVMAGDDRLARQAIDAYNGSRIPDGLTQGRYPSQLTQMIPTFSLMWVGMVHDFWRYRGDPAYVRAQLAGTRTVLGWYLDRQRPDGMLGRLPWWPFVDWGKDFRDGMPPQDADGGSSVITLQFLEALRDGGELETALGDPAVAARYRQAADRAAAGIRSRCWNAQYQLLADTPAQQHFSQHANLLGVWLDVIPAGAQRDVLTKILSTSDAGFSASGPVPPMTAATYYFRFYLARALAHAGMSDDYLRLLGPWRQMVSLGLTTWAESPEPTRSDSHAWSAHPNYDLLTLVAGIEPKTPGFGTVSIAPHLGALTHLSARMPIPQGVVEVEYTREAGGLGAHVVLPAGVTGEFVWGGRTTVLRGGSQDVSLR